MEKSHNLQQTCPCLQWIPLHKDVRSIVSLYTHDTHIDSNHFDFYMIREGQRTDVCEQWEHVLKGGITKISHSKFQVLEIVFTIGNTHCYYTILSSKYLLECFTLLQQQNRVAFLQNMRRDRGLKKYGKREDWFIGTQIPHSFNVVCDAFLEAVKAYTLKHWHPIPNIQTTIHKTKQILIPDMITRHSKKNRKEN